MSTHSAQPTDQAAQELHGGRLIARRLKAHGVSKLFTLSAATSSRSTTAAARRTRDRRRPPRATAAFAAEGWAKVTREPGVCALTAGPGVTNGMSAIASAQANHTPILVLGGGHPRCAGARAPCRRSTTSRSCAPCASSPTTAQSTVEIPGLVDEAFAAALAPHGGPTFLDFPLDYVFMSAPSRTPHTRAWGRVRRQWIPRRSSGPRGYSPRQSVPW